MKPLTVLSALFLALACAACDHGTTPRDLPGIYGADRPALGSYASKVTLELRPQGTALMTLATDDGQPSSIRTGAWAFDWGKVTVTLFTKDLATGPKSERLAPDEVLVLKYRDGKLKAVDPDVQRWKTGDLILDRKERAPAH